MVAHGLFPYTHELTAIANWSTNVWNVLLNSTQQFVSFPFMSTVALSMMYDTLQNLVMTQLSSCYALTDIIISVNIVIMQNISIFSIFLILCNDYISNPTMEESREDWRKSSLSIRWTNKGGGSLKMMEQCVLIYWNSRPVPTVLWIPSVDGINQDSVGLQQ